MLIDFANASLVDKAPQQPEKVKLLLEKAATNGWVATLDAVQSKRLPLPLGYCNVGSIVDVGEGINDFSVGDRVVSNGPAQT